MEVAPYIQTYRLSELTSCIEETLTNAFAHDTFWVIADITDYKYYAHKDHRYFTLVEKNELTHTLIAKMSGVCWRSGSARIKEFEKQTGQKFGDGINVLVQVMVDYHAVYGLKLTVTDINTAFTLGRLAEERQVTLNRLATECADFVQASGNRYITYNNSLQLHTVIQKIAVVTSSASAGYEDFEHTLTHNAFNYKFSTDAYFTAVQGELNAEGLCNKLSAICNSGIAYDAVIIMRGGGAQTDFLLFDQYELCRLIACMPFPVITGIGHHKNRSIVDLMAHTATKTPTQAAEFLIAHNRRFEERLIALRSSLVIKTQQLVAQQGQALANTNYAIINQTKNVLAQQKNKQQQQAQLVINASKNKLHTNKAFLFTLSNITVVKPKLLAAAEQARLQHLATGFALFTKKYVAAQQEQLHYYTVYCQLLNPANILKRGFALVYYNQQLITNNKEVPAGETITIQLANGDVYATIQH